MNEDQPKLPVLTVLDLKNMVGPSDYPSLVRELWNKELEHFSYINQREIKNDEYRVIIEEDEILSMLGPKVTSFGFSGSISTRIPRLLRSLYSLNGGSLENLPAFTQMTSLTLKLPSDINNCELPPNLLRITLNFPRDEIDSLKFPPTLVKLSIRSAKFKDLAIINFPSEIVDLELEICNITLTTGWLKPAQLKTLSLAGNKLFKALLPCCEFLNLRSNKLTEVEIEAPFLEHIDLTTNKLTSTPKLSICLQVPSFGRFGLYLPKMSELPPNLKLVELSGAGTGAFQNYTFPSSIEELHFTGLDLSGMSGVKFAQGSRLKELILSKSILSSMDEDYLTTIDDRMIELPPGLKALKLRGMDLQNIDGFTIPQSVTFLDLGENDLKSFEVKSHIETLYLDYNPIEDNFVVHEDLELRVLDLEGVGIRMFSFEMVKAEKLAQLRLGAEVEMIDLSKMPANFQILEHQDGGNCTLKEPDTGQSYIYGPLMARISLRY